MNYYNPYFYSMPSKFLSSTPKVGLLTKIFGKSGATLSTILSGTQKVLGVANQAIPLVKQVGPMVNNAKTMFKIMNEFKRSDTKNIKQQTNQTTIQRNSSLERNNNNSNTEEVSTTNNNSNNSNLVQDNDNGLTFFV